MSSIKHSIQITSDIFWIYISRTWIRRKATTIPIIFVSKMTNQWWTHWILAAFFRIDLNQYRWTVDISDWGYVSSNIRGDINYVTVFTTKISLATRNLEKMPERNWQCCWAQLFTNFKWSREVIFRNGIYTYQYSRQTEVSYNFRLPYVESTIRESLRHETLVPSGLPHTALVNTKLMGYDIPKVRFFNRILRNSDYAKCQLLHKKIEY